MDDHLGNLPKEVAKIYWLRMRDLTQDIQLPAERRHWLETCSPRGLSLQDKYGGTFDPLCPKWNIKTRSLSKKTAFSPGSPGPHSRLWKDM